MLHSNPAPFLARPVRTNREDSREEWCDYTCHAGRVTNSHAQKPHSLSFCARVRPGKFPRVSRTIIAVWCHGRLVPVGSKGGMTKRFICISQKTKKKKPWLQWGKTTGLNRICEVVIQKWIQRFITEQCKQLLWTQGYRMEGETV